MKHFRSIGLGCLILLALSITLNTADARPHTCIYKQTKEELMEDLRDMVFVFHAPEAMGAAQYIDLPEKNYHSSRRQAILILGASDSFMYDRNATRMKTLAEALVDSHQYRARELNDEFYKLSAILCEPLRYDQPAIEYPRPVNHRKPDNTNAQLNRIKALGLHTLRRSYTS